MLFMAFPTYDRWWLAWVALVPLLVATHHSKPWGAFGLGALFGLVTNVGGFYWIFGLLKDFAKMSDAMATPITGLLCGYQGLLFGFWAGAIAWLRRRWPTLPVWAAAAPTLLALELAMPFIFPWYLGNSQYKFPLASQVADVFGVLGVSAVVLLGNLVLHEAVVALWARARGVERRPQGRLLVAASALIVAALVYGKVRIEQVDALQAAAPKLRVGMAEGDIGIQEKNTPEEFFSNILTYQHLSKRLDAQGVELIVWPESSFQAESIWFSTSDNPDRLFLELDSLFEPAHRDALLPALRALEVGFGRAFHHDWVWQHVLYQVGYQGMRDPARFAAPDGVTFLLPGWDPLYATRHLPCASHSDCPDHMLCLKRLDSTCQPLGTTRWSRQSIRRDFKAPVIFGGLMIKARDQLKGSYREMLRDKMSRDLFNVAFLMDGDGRILDRYKKVYLLKFGEVLPLSGWFPQLYDWFPNANRFTPGDKPQVFDLHAARLNQTVRLGMMICYEDILPAFVRELAQLRPQVMVNVTNDAWFGKTSEPYLHLALATFRSIETRTWLVRSTNTGVSAYVDAVGRVVAETSLEGAETLVADVAVMSGEPTLYTRLGDVLGWLSIAASALLFGLATRQRRPPQTPPPAQAP
jgi:apolipoprotein N-acyltransferase